MYWLCIAGGLRAIIFSPIDPMDTSDLWDETYCYDTREEAEEALDE